MKKIVFKKLSLPLTRPLGDLSHKGRGVLTRFTTVAHRIGSQLIMGKDTSPLVGEVASPRRRGRAGEGSFFLSFAIVVLVALSFSLKEAMATAGTEKYENYLNDLKTLAGDFTQVNSQGKTAQGKIQISRPGRMRLTYAPPSSLLIVADGKWLITKDIQADDVNYVSLENTPAAFILRPQVRFSGDVAITSLVPKDNNTTEISLVRTEDPDAGYITLVFQDNPVALKEWSVVDAQGIKTQVVLSNIQTNIQLPADLFYIESPNLIQQIF